MNPYDILFVHILQFIDLKGPMEITFLVCPCWNA